jgi:hypothetical protein
MDWIAVHTLPPNKPTGLTLFGHAVTWLDTALVIYPAIVAVGLILYSGNWLWLPAIALCMLLAIVMWW